MSNAQQMPVNGLAERWLQGAGTFFTFLWFSLVTLTIAWGWSNRNEDLLTAESGLGYALGIIGSSLMMLLLTYSLRKRWRPLRKFFSVRFWFQFHMILGVVGPVAILFHSNFQIASLNSTVTLICMLLVAGSGLLGRYLYTRIHYGLFGEKVRVKQMVKDFEILESEILAYTESAKQKERTQKLFASIKTLLEEQKDRSGIIAAYVCRRQARKISAALKRLIKQLVAYHRKNAMPNKELIKLQKKLKQRNDIMMAALKKIPGLQLSERLFSLWHVVHIPIFILMIISAVVHIWVVHMY